MTNDLWVEQGSSGREMRKNKLEENFHPMAVILTS
jgi:hypothetical protein